MRLVLCDDHALFADSLAGVLRVEGHDVVATAHRLADGVVAVAEHKPDVCLLDVVFPSGSGIEAIPAMRAACPSVKIVLLSAWDPPEVVAEAFRAGAAGFVRKDQRLDVIIRAIEQVSAGVIVLDPISMQQVMSGRHAAPREDPLRFLTERERAVLAEIVAGRNTAQIAEALHIRLSTTRTHIQNILMKLGVHSRLEVAALVHSLGRDQAVAASLMQTS